MNAFIEHIPSIVDTDKTPQRIEFETTGELLEIPHVKRATEWSDFTGYAISGSHLMVITKEGFSHWVLGTLDDPSSVDVPQWEGWKFKAKMADGTIKVIGKEVVSSRGNVLTLEDGSKSVNIGY